MIRPPVFAPAALLAAAAAWALTLAFGEPTIGGTAAAVATVDLLAVTITAIVGIVVARARWARRFALATIGLMAAMALTMPISNNWIIAILLSGLAVVAVTGPSLDEYIKPPVTGAPPPKAVALPLALLLLPAVAAFAARTHVPIAAWIVIIGAPITAVAYGKALAAGLWSARVAIPAACFATMWWLSWWSVLLLGIAACVEGWLAWSGEAAVAIRESEPVPAARSISIPPELAPPEILAEAGLDDRGRRLPSPSSEIGAARSEE